MAWTQDDIDRLKSLMATGTRRTKFVAGDTSREQELHSLLDMERLLASMTAEVQGAMAPQRSSVTQFSRD